MEYLKSGLKSVLGTNPPENQPSGAETVEKLVDRVKFSTLLDDRRDACRALKALSKTYTVEVGTKGMDALKQVLEMDRTDCEIVGLALDTLCNITLPPSFDEEDNYSHQTGEQFTEIFIKEVDNVGLVLSFLEEYDFKVRWPALKLLYNLLMNQTKEIQEIVLISPMGVSKLMDLLEDSREIIRNEALLLLIHLTKGNANIQKIVAFENAFDRIFDIIENEDGVRGGIVVEDCLKLMLNLLKGNNSNQNFFNEGSYIKKLTPMFHLPPETDDNPLGNWSEQLVSNVHCLVQLVRALVAPGSPAQAVFACQRSINMCGLLQALCDILMANGVPADVLTETINAVAEVIRGNENNQNFLSNVMAPSSPPRPAIVVLLMSMVNEKQPFLLRCAVLYCFQCYLFKNETGQKQLVQTLLPQGNETPMLTGQLLCSGLFSTDSLSNWFSAVALSHTLIDNPNQKEQLLRVLLATNIGKPPVTLMQQCMLLLQQGTKIQSKLGLLILLCHWVSYCSAAVRMLLSIDTSISYLMALLSSQDNHEEVPEILMQSMCALLIGLCVHFNDDSVSNYTKEKLCNLIENRIGLERFQDAIGGISRHEVYSRSLKHPQPSSKEPSELLLDHEFCRFLKTLEGIVIKSIMDGSSSQRGKGQLNIMSPSDSVLLAQYKGLIRDQDIQIQTLKQTVENLMQEKLDAEMKDQESQAKISSLKDQNMVLRAAQTSLTDGKNPSNLLTNHLDSTNDEINQYKNQIKDLNDRLSECSITINKYQLDENAQIKELENKLKQTTDELNTLKSDQDNLLILLTHLTDKTTILKKRLIALGERVDSEESSDEYIDDEPNIID